MKIIKPSVEFFGAVPTDYDNAIKFIEMAGRTCYKSEDKITEDSAEKFVKKLIKAGHLAMVEHSNFVVRTKRPLEDYIYQLDKFLTVFYQDNYQYIGGNLTAWYNFSSKYLFSYGVSCFVKIYGDLFNINSRKGVSEWEICPHNEIPKELHRYSAKFICDRGVSHELVRHRPCSFAQESTRYVNYSGKDMEFIEPDGYDYWNDIAQSLFYQKYIDSENKYKILVDKDLGNLSPQQARAILPNSLKTEIVVTADAQEWSHIRNLRTSSAAHPDMQRVMNMMPWKEFL